jgi:glycosyltransferase involved in cell wall biosynthesis
MQNKYFAYGPYVREMNIWIRYVDKVIIVAPKSDLEKTPIDSSYEHDNIEFVAIESFDILNVKSIVRTVFKTPTISWSIFKAMREANHIHLRCPGNIGLLGCFIQIVFPSKIKTAKYAGNWDPKSKQSWTYRLQQWILSSTILSRNMQVLVYGEWESSTKNIKPFFTATYTEEEKLPVAEKELEDEINFIFVGTLVSGKNPLYAIQLVAALAQKEYNVALSLYGDGIERGRLEHYIVSNQLDKIISLKGNQTPETIKRAYQNSQFVILPSDSEGWPKAIAEGMFWGCVPLVTPVSCLPFMLDYGKRGVLLDMDLESDAKQISDCILDINDYLSKSLAGQKWSQQFTLNLFEEKINELMAN